MSMMLLSREDVEIDDKTTNKAKTPPTILPESNILASNNAAISNNDDNSTNGDSKPSARPKGNVASDAIKDSQGCISALTTSNKDTVFQDFLCQLILLNFQLWMMSVRSLRPMRRNRAIIYPFKAVSLVCLSLCLQGTCELHISD